MAISRVILVLSLAAGTAIATIFGSVHGLIHDPQHRPVAGATVTIHSETSDWTQAVTSDENGEFRFAAVPVGRYAVTVTDPNFAGAEQKIAVESGSAVSLHFALNLPKVKQTVEVSGEPAEVNPQSSTSQTTVTRRQIARTPGSDRANSLNMITDYVPSATIVHDQIHVRGGHQVSWLIDGIPVPNTNIASNVGPQFDPKDIDTIEVQRGGYSAEYGDRTYGMFNVVTRSGFERNKQGELIASYGSFHETNDQLSFGSHTDRFAYFASVSGNRTDLGLETPEPTPLHDQSSGLGGFLSLIYNQTPADQLRLVLSSRADHYQVPNTAEQQAEGIRDIDQESDRFATFSWVHTAPDGLLLTLAPFYHFNSAHYIGGPLDFPVRPDDAGGSNYFGGVASVGITRGKHNASIGFQGFAEREARAFSALDPLASDGGFSQQYRTWGNLEAGFLEDQYRATDWLTFNGGVRLTRFAGLLTETSADPRIGAAVRLPRLEWVLHAFYGTYYQAPPLETVSGPGLAFAGARDFGFLPLHGERDQQHEFGITIPFRGWVFEGTNFATFAHNYFDHDVLGNSNIFLPLTIARARLHGWESAVRSPLVWKRLRAHLAYSHQYAEGAGGVTGGLIEFLPPKTGYFFLDHDQRDTLSVGGQADLPRHSWLAANLNYGSGFLNGDGPQHLPPHSTLDLSLGTDLGQAWSARLTILNVDDNRYLIDNSNTFGGTHYINPREVSLQVRYRFKY